jgi:Tol biopolymer transport system component
VGGLSVSPDRRQLALDVFDKESKVLVFKIIDMEGKTSRHLLQFRDLQKQGKIVTPPVWTPDGRHLVFGQGTKDKDQAGIWFVPVEGGDARKLNLVGLDPTFIQHIAIHPREPRLAFTNVSQRQYQIWALENFLPPLDEPSHDVAKASREPAPGIEASSNAPIFRVLKIAATAAPKDLSPDGTTVAFTDVDHKIAVYDLATGQSRAYEMGWHPKFSPDGKRVAFQFSQTGVTGEIQILSLATGEIEKTGIEGKPKNWTPDGRSLHFGRSQWATEPKESQVLHLANKHVESAYPATKVLAEGLATPSPDGKYAAYSKEVEGNTDLYLVPIGGGNEIRLTRDPATETAPRWSSDGQSLLFKSDRSAGQWGLWALHVKDGRAVGEPILIRPNVGREAEIHIWSQSGRVLFSTSTATGHIYRVTIDPNAGLPTGAAQQLTDFGVNTQASWSPDGK